MFWNTGKQTTAAKKQNLMALAIPWFLGTALFYVRHAGGQFEIYF